MIVLEILKSAINNGLKLPRDPIQSDILSLALDFYANSGKELYDLWTWDNRNIDELTMTPDSDGIITFDVTVDIVRAVKAVATGSSDNDDTFIWPQDQINAAILGKLVSPDRFVYLSNDATTGGRRIQVNSDDAIAEYKVLAFKKFIPAVIDDDYDSTDPTATPTDYRVIEFPIDHLNPAIIAKVADDLREWDGQKLKNDWEGLVKIARQKVDSHQVRGHVVHPPEAVFGELGNWS